MVQNWFKENIDFTLIASILALMVIGCLSVYSATYDAGASKYFSRQVIWMGAGFCLMVVVALLSFRTLQVMALPLYIASLLLLASVLILGRTIAGSTSWFGVKGFGLQPSEFVKATTILMAATYLSQRSVNLHKMKDLFKAAAIFAIPAMLIMAQPDMGTAIIYVGMTLVVLFWGGASNFLMIAAALPGIAAIAALFGTTPFVVVVLATLVLLLYLRENPLLSALSFSGTVLVGISVQMVFARLAPHQQKRLLIFMNPDSDPLGAGYNVMQSKIAIGSGGLFGKGFLQGTQTQLNFLPAQWTDFIFCVPSEEFGFIGGFIILSLLTIILLRGVQIARSVKSSFASFVAIGVTGAFLVHIIINAGMSMGIVPVIGVPLPFMSYGGSNILTNFVMAGLLLNMHANRKEY
jgi:rod shape determining protein RodA